MMTITKFVAAGATLAALTGCVETTGAAVQLPLAPGVAAGGPVFITTMDPSVSSAAVGACKAALDGQTDGAVSVVGSEFSQANSAVYMRVGANGAPWRCLVSNTGANPQVMFMGSEGSL